MRAHPSRPAPVRLALLAALAVALAGLVPAGGAGAQGISGSGSTFVQPLLNRWWQSYQRTLWTAESQTADQFDYEPVGSQAGIMRSKERAVDFGATEIPLSPEELSGYGLAQFPLVIGGIAAAVNLPGVQPGALKLSGELLADIYLGRVKTWSDPAVKALNPDLALPDAPITVVRRADGSGTTATFTAYLAKMSPAWGPVGSGLTVAWPLGQSAKGNDGVADLVRRTSNSIGYVDFASARRAGLSVAALRNRSGAFVLPSPTAFQAAAAAASAEPRAAGAGPLSLADAPGEASYPLVATTYAIVPRQNPAALPVQKLLGFLDWGFAFGAAEATELGYVPLPASAIDEVRRSWSENLGWRPDPSALATFTRRP